MWTRGFRKTPRAPLKHIRGVWGKDGERLGQHLQTFVVPVWLKKNKQWPA